MDLSELTVTETIKGLYQKKFSSVDITRSLFEKIKPLDKKIKAFVTIDSENALKKAEEADEKRKKGDARPFLGVPFTLKDNICTQGLRTTASAKVLENYIPQYDATISKKLKDAGVVILGKTNMDAWAHGSSTETSDFFTTLNPWDLEKLPGGSSGGSAATVAADLTIGSIGTETAGSIRQPASWCGVVGLKPTYGRVSRYGIISMGSSLDSPGPMTKTVEDAALTLPVIAGKDPQDATTSSIKLDDYLVNLKKGVKNLKVGISEEYQKIAEPIVREAVEKALKTIEKLGAIIVPVKLLDPTYSISVYTILQRAEVSANLARYDGIRYGEGREKFGEEAKRRIMLGTYALSAGYYDALYGKAQQIRTLIVEDFKKVFQKIDCIIAPTTPCVALPLGSSKTSPMFGEVQDVLVEPSTIAGLPGITLRCGFVGELPIGIQIIGPQFSEALILKVAYAYEQNTDWHKRKPNII
ncbi:glutaminyl-tRNA synthase (glutamine-hydrolyzing) subunit A [Candidatus Gottesmanbacteria bacterium RIFCSPHIGHO2_02_FULL_39_11]|uniref:Glutamyl-tRNA(Gln) amidotransferase subunit A n=1 Tax=Candidatus Gottesmanbacteria bacterium RIFCSPHIGHO2_02_FULL_39_11 TaxID=1798382 RepID=A0A1F5ZTK0_9BACT|nr:MAG: glutaminyl-tRNA synthase (glutamine-hydrolyzing) subunit A [Candidatus Gottesmanbacteria bacterium RIFCSPHIGHO2_02_FULL_39_11]